MDVPEINNENLLELFQTISTCPDNDKRVQAENIIKSYGKFLGKRLPFSLNTKLLVLKHHSFGFGLIFRFSL